MSGNDDERGLIWKLPELKFKDFGKVGPAFGTGLGCGVGVGVGLVGGKNKVTPAVSDCTFLCICCRQNPRWVLSQLG